MAADADDEDGRDGTFATIGRLRRLKRGEWRAVVVDLKIDPPPPSSQPLADAVAEYLVSEVVTRWALHATKTATPIVAAALRALTGKALAELATWARREE